MFGNLAQVSRIFCGLFVLVTSPRSQEYWAKFCGLVVLVTSPRSQEHTYIYIYIYYTSFVLGNPSQSFRIQRAESNPVLLLFNLLVSFVFFLFLLITTTDRTIWPGIMSPGENRVARGNRTQEKKGKFGKLWESCHLFYYLFILFLNGR